VGLPKPTFSEITAPRALLFALGWWYNWHMKKIFKLLLLLVASVIVGFGVLFLSAVAMYVLIDVGVKVNAEPLLFIILGVIGAYGSFFGVRWFLGFFRTIRAERLGKEKITDVAVPKKARLLFAPLWTGFTTTIGALIFLTITAFQGEPGGFGFFSGMWPVIFLTGFAVAFTFLGSIKSSGLFRKLVIFLTIVSLFWWLGIIFTVWCQDTGTHCVPFYNPS